SLIKERFSSSDPTEDKEIALWVELKRLFEPDEDEELWKFESFELIWRLLRFVPDCGLSSTCVLLQKIMRFVKILRFARKDPAVCQNPAFCYKRSYGTMFLNVEQLEKQLDKEDFKEIGSMAAFNTIPEFRDMLIQQLESVKKSIDERVQLKREYDSWVNERQMQTIEEKVDTSQALDVSSVDTESSRPESKEHDTSSSSGNDAHDDVADIRPIYDEDPMAEVQTTTEINVFAIGQQHTEQPKFNNEGEVVQNVEECHDTFVRQPTAFKSKQPRISKFRCDSQVDVHNDLSKPVTTHYLPKEREVAPAKPHHMIASSNSRISPKNMPRFNINDMVHNYYQKEAKKKTQECSRNSEPSLMPSARSKSTTNGSKPMPRRNTQTSRNWPASKNSFVTTKTKCVFSENHDSCVTKFLKEVNSRAKVPSNKTMSRNKPVVQKKTLTPRSCLRWKPMGKIFKTVGLRWVPTGRILISSTTKVDSEPLNGSNADITNQYECEQTLDVSAGTSYLSTGTSFNTKEEGLRVWLLKRQISHKPGLQGIFI
nr:hypothetical protein [Tanacetum cinerariifolium]